MSFLNLQDKTVVVFGVAKVLLVEGFIQGSVGAGEGERLVGIFPGYLFLLEMNFRRVLRTGEECPWIRFQILVLVFVQRGEVSTGVLGWAVEKGSEKVPGEDIVVFSQRKGGQSIL